MITLTELKCIADAQSSYHILKPWWDVFCYYLTLIMLLVAVLAGALQLTQTRLLCCLPCKLEFDNRCAVPWEMTRSSINISSSSATPAIRSLRIQNSLHRQQYSYIDAVCYERELHWFAKFFPYLVLLHTFIFAACSNFWLYYPSTSSRLEHFVAILHKCFDSPWTTRALSETVAEQSVRTASFSKSKTFLSSPSNLTELESKRQSLSYSQSGLETAGRENSSNVLDRKEGEQAKSIFEKVKRFRVHVEKKDVIYRVYLQQIVAKVIVFILIMIYVPYYLTFITLEIDCIVDIQVFTGYKRYQCVYSLAEIFKVLASFYVILAILYGLTCTYSLLWMLRSSLKQYSFEKLREQSNYSDIPDVKNDFAFILHLADQYDPLYAKRFSIFLSEVSENKLKQISLNNEWSLERLKSRLVRNSQDKIELHLFMLSGLPDDIFELTEIEVLTLELIPEVKLPPSVNQLSNLKELNVYHSSLTVEYPALHFVEENLKILRLKSADLGKIPRWVFYLKNLQELYLTGCYMLEPQNLLLYNEGLQDLVNLKAIHLKNSLSRIPQVVTDQLPLLQKLSIDNEGRKLLVLTNLKKMVNLRTLELISCDLERIPHSIFSLNYLREIDLKENNLRTVEEIISFQHLENLSCLKLWHNNISYIPVQVGTLANLEQLYLNHNNIQKIPPQLFLCTKLHYLDLSYNKLTSIPEEIQYLTNLQYFAVTKNHVSSSRWLV